MIGKTKITGKALAILFGTAAAVGGTGVLVKDDAGQPIISSLLSGNEAVVPSAEPKAEVEAETSEQVASLPETKTEEPAVEPAIVDPKLPVFDVLRVEKDGSVVVAGRAPADSMVEIFSNGEVVATGKAGATGEFAIVFEEPLAPGDHELLIRATPEGEEPIISAEAGIVTVPEAGDTAGEVMVMVQKSGEASRILQAPEVAKTEEESTEVAALEQPENTQEETKVEVAPVEEAKPVDHEEETENAEVKTTSTPVLVQAIDVEPNKVFVAGKGEPGTFVRVYINGELKGTTKVAPTGAFLFEMNEGLVAGKHDLRVDALSSDGKDVISRAAVVIDHESESVAVAEAKPEQPETKPVETAAVEPESKPETVVKVEPVEIKPETVVEAEPVETKTEVAAVEPSTEAPAKTTDIAEAKPKQVVTDVEEEAVTEELAKPVEAVTQTAEAKPESVAPATKEAEPVAEAKPVIVTGRSVIIRRGDNLWRISRRMLGEGRKYTMIFSANTNQIKDPDRIYPGQVFDVPDEEEAKAADAQKDAG